MKFKVHDKASAPEASQELLATAEQELGMIPNVLGVLAESPLALNAYMSLDAMRRQSVFTRTEQQFILLAISESNRCAYCVAAHSMLAQQDRVAPEVIEALRAGHSVPDEKLEALRRFLVTLKEKQGWADENDLEEFAAAGYGPRHVLDVLALLAMKTISNYANHMADTPVDGAFAAYRWDPDGR